MIQTVSRYELLVRDMAACLRALLKDTARASRQLAWPRASSSRSIHVSGMSTGWLRDNAIESAKHCEDG